MWTECIFSILWNYSLNTQAGPGRKKEDNIKREQEKLSSDQALIAINSSPLLSWTQNPIQKIHASFPSG